MNRPNEPNDYQKPTWVESFKREWHQSKTIALVYLILRIMVVTVLILEAFRDNWYNVFLCVLTLVLFLLPNFVEKRFKIILPTGLEVIVIIFIFAAEVLGEISQFYIHVGGWDTLLHVVNGFLAAAIGFSLIDILNRSDNIALTLAPKYVALSSFCFSMTIGVMWEFYEYFMDVFFNTDMQKDAFIDSVSSTLLNPNGEIEPYTEEINSVVVNGQAWQGYIDIGLIDTMNDLMVNFLGAVIFSVYGYIYIKGRSKGVNKLVNSIVPTMEKEVDEK